MIEVIGNKNCAACLVTKRLLTDRGVEFEYKIYDDMPADERSRVMDIARAANALSFPIILRDGIAVKATEVI